MDIDDAPDEMPLGCFLRKLCPEEMERWRAAEEAFERDPHSRPPFAGMSARRAVIWAADRACWRDIKAVHERLWGAMTAGDYVGLAHTPPYGEYAPIPPDRWPTLLVVSRPFDHVAPGSLFTHFDGNDEPDRILMVTRAISDIQQPFHVIIQRAAGISPEAACRAWLRAEVAAGPRSKPKFLRPGKTSDRADTPENSYWGEARERFPTLSKRAFEVAWAEMTRERSDWTAPGRRKK